MSSNDRIVEKLRFIFEIYDLDGDGRIEKKEMIRVIECLYDLRDVPKSELDGSIQDFSYFFCLYNPKEIKTI
jgi:Ca2+-binding EF-hand superfamily protein